MFQMAEVTVLRELSAAILERTQWFGVPPPLVQRGCVWPRSEKHVDSGPGNGWCRAETPQDRRSKGGRDRIVTMKRLDGQESRRERPLSLESGSSSGYGDGLRFDNGEMSVRGDAGLRR